MAGPIGAAIGGAVGGMVAGAIGDALGMGEDKPPPAVGAAHFSWDANGNIQHTIDSNQSGGGDAANSVAAGVLHMLEQVLKVINDKNTDLADDVAINPYCLPTISFYGEWGGARMEVTTRDGHVATQSVSSPDFAQWLLKVVQDTGGIAPAWQVQTLQIHAQQMRLQGASEAEVASVAGITNTYEAHAGETAVSVLGNAVESADFMTQSFGALVVHVHDDPHVQAAQTQLSDVLRDVEGDGYFEKSQWVSATDAHGNLQGMLTIDFNGNGQIETRDILNLGGNVGLTVEGVSQSTNPTDEARLAAQNATLQRNNMQWLDANGDGLIDKSDPAFAAIKLWIDANQDGQMQATESKSLDVLHITSINFRTSEITYADGSTDALTAASLTGETEGIRLTKIQEADANGVLHSLAAGDVLEHEGYQGQVQVSDNMGTHWIQQRNQTYEQQALRTGDWEGGADQDTHRHGGGNLEGAPIETIATGVTDFGPIRVAANQSTQTTQITMGLGDSRIRSNTISAVSVPARSSDGRIAFVPMATTSVNNEILSFTESLIQSSQNNLFVVGGNANLGMLAAIGLGVLPSAQAVEQDPTLGNVAAAVQSPLIAINRIRVDDALQIAESVRSDIKGSVNDVHLGVFAIQQRVEASESTEISVYATVMTSVSTETTPLVASATYIDASPVTANAISVVNPFAVDYPKVKGEVLKGTEDVVLRLTQSVLLANDSTPNASANPSANALTITGVSQPLNGQVSLINGEVFFVPTENFNGTASFTYTVTDQYGLSTNSSATLQIAAVNDAPSVVGESIESLEDEVVTIAASALLQNDYDIDSVHADLTISRVQSGAGGVASINSRGDVVFTPTPNYNGTATLTYWVQDALGAESNAVTATFEITPVNDAPMVQGEIVVGASEDAMFHISKATLLANDHDVDDPTSALNLSWVGNATNGTVSLDANGNVVFTPTENFNGNATFQYKIRDAAGAESAIAQVVVAVAAVNDVPVAVDDQFTTYINSTMTIAFNQLTSNDADIDHDALTVSSVRDNAHGHVSIVDGQVQFVADSNFTGTASFDYLTDDEQGGQAWATAFVDVRIPPNLYPTMEVTSVNFFGTEGNAGRAIDAALASWHAVDDGNAGAVSCQLTGMSVYLMPFFGRDAYWSSLQGVNEFSYGATGLRLDVGRGSGFTEMRSTWLLTDDRGLQNIWHFNYSMSGGTNAYSEHSGYFTPPVILDLNGDGVHFTSIKNSNVTMDVNFDGIQDKMAWAGNDDGVLVWDKDHNHEISDASEFGFQTLKVGAQTDLEGLQALDTNGNGLLDVCDVKFAEFAVWQDANGNGVTDAGEFKTLAELGIADINLHSDGQMRDAGTLLASSGTCETDATVMGNASFTRTNGSTGLVADTMLAYEAGHAQTAEVVRQAMLFNQVCNTEIVIDSTPLGFVPIQPDVQLHDMLVTLQDGSHQLMHSA
jgi:hypothetical protein